MNSEFHSPVEWFMQIMYKSWMEGTHDKHIYKFLFRDYLTNSDGGFGTNAYN